MTALGVRMYVFHFITVVSSSSSVPVSACDLRIASKMMLMLIDGDKDVMSQLWNSLVSTKRTWETRITVGIYGLACEGSTPAEDESLIDCCYFRTKTAEWRVVLEQGREAENDDGRKGMHGVVRRGIYPLLFSFVVSM